MANKSYYILFCIQIKTDKNLHVQDVLYALFGNLLPFRRREVSNYCSRRNKNFFPFVEFPLLSWHLDFFRFSFSFFSAIFLKFNRDVDILMFLNVNKIELELKPIEVVIRE